MIALEIKRSKLFIIERVASLNKSAHLAYE
jgi:hypothetical protein